MVPRSSFDAVPPVAITIRIGVIGHRRLTNSDLIHQRVNKALADLDSWLAGTPHDYRVLSSLADGADRLVAMTVFDWTKRSDAPGPLPLEVVLPMPGELYCHTFDPENRKAASDSFHALADRAEETIVVQPPAHAPSQNLDRLYENQEVRDWAYRKAGEEIADRSDVVIAVWDGLPAHGAAGTGRTVAYAQRKGRPVIWISTKSGKISYPQDFVAQIRLLAEYNSESVPESAARDGIERRRARLARLATDARLAIDLITPMHQSILPHLVKATTRARHYQHLYLRLGTTGYAFAAAAVATAACLSLIWPHAPHYYYLIEAALVACAGLIGLSLKFAHWQPKWIDRRYLAERLRAACFLYAAGMDFELPIGHPDQQFPSLSGGWANLELREITRKLFAEERVMVTQDKSQVQALARYLRDAWIADQQDYYHRRSKWNHGLNDIFELASLVLLLGTLAIAIADAFDLLAWFGNWRSALAVTLPALVSALAGISVFLHFDRNAERYESMNHFLEQIGNELEAAGALSEDPVEEPDLQRIRSLVRTADQAMAHEHEGWRTVFGVRLPGPG